MQVLSIEPFVPSGKDFPAAVAFFKELGFNVNWDAGDYIGFENGGCKFILQNFVDDNFAANFMLSVKVPNVEEFWQELKDKDLVSKFGVKVGAPTQQPYGKEVNVIDRAGVCWHFVE